MAFTIFTYFGFFNKQGPALIGQESLSQLAQFACGTSTGQVALAGGGQTGATVCSYGDVEFTTVATTNDSCQLPLAIPGAECIICNSGAATLAVFANAAQNTNNGSVVDQIVVTNTTAKTANGTAVTIAAGHVSGFNCTTPGIWKQQY